MNNIELKNGDVIVITTHGDDIIAIFNKIDKSLWGSNDAFHLYANLYKTSLICVGDGDIDECAYDINDIYYRLATDEEKHEIYNALGRRFTDDYDKDWYNHFTDSSYFDVQDFLFNVFGINVEYYDNDMIYPDFIDEIHNYIWDGLCKATGNYQEKNVEPEMVNKQEFVEKTISYFTPILKTYCSEECVKELIDGFVNSME